MDSIHQSVMPEQVIEYLQAVQPGRYLDCTLGGGGHSRLILESNQQNQVYAIDRDPEAIIRSKSIQNQYPDRFFAQQASFEELSELFVNIKFDGILADLGISSDQLLIGRGFSFNDESSLDMRMDTSEGITAADVINHCSKSDLIRIFRKGGVKGDLNAIANSVLKSRPFQTAKSLADAVEIAVRRTTNNKKKIHPATLVFQAIRIEVNQEFRQIESLLSGAKQLIAPGGRLVIISFHSLEDKLVTKRLRSWSSAGSQPALWAGEADKDLQSAALGTLITKNAVVPGEVEIEKNSRARSARLRSFIFN